jgi:colicin import membrane protein
VNTRAISPGAVLLAVLMHAAVVASFMFAWEFGQPRRIETPLVIKATLTSIPDVVSAPAEPAVTDPEPVPDPEPEPEPVVEEPPEPPPPDPSVEERLRLEREKLEQEAEIERQRLEEIRQREEEAARQKALEEQRRKEEAERKRQQEEAERKRREEAELEERRRQAELERQREIERQREENERMRREEDQEALASAIAAEEARNEARNSDEMTAYLFALQQRVVRNWSPPPSRPDGLSCEVRVRQTPGGEVLDARVLSCNGDAAVERSIEAAVRRASPLPVPQNSLLFDSTIIFEFKPDD